ncbi:MAG TPA: hypothetical protein VFH89_09760 [Sphingomicrobium sp.]|nr:hypothetical protein [Sphingomicrobium sp.]
MVLSVLIALKIVLLFLFAWSSRFVMDEFVQLGWAKYLNDGLYDTIWPGKAVGYAVFYKLAHLIGWNATSILLIGRLQTALVGCAILAMIYACARALGEDRLRALAIVLVLLSFSNFIERIFRTIAEPLAVSFAVAALLVVLRSRADRPRTVVLAGALSGLSFLATQKAVYFDVALGLALVADAALSRRYVAGFVRVALLVLGWLIPIAAYCLVFGGADPFPIARSLVFGPVEVASSSIATEYGGLRHYVAQTLLRNFPVYLFCFAGMVFELVRIRQIVGGRRIALIFSMIVTALVFAHNQPWPYVFIMALPFMVLWSLVPLERLADNRSYLRLALLVLSVGIAISFIRNVQYLRIDNNDQLALVERAESMLAPNEVYFDGIGMLPNRPETSTLWLDRHYVLKTLREKQGSEAYRIFAEHPPKVLLWSYRMDAIEPVVGPLISGGYVQIAPNLRMAGRRLIRGEPTSFDVPVAGRYVLYDEAGERLHGQVDVKGVRRAYPLHLDRGPTEVVLQSGAERALLLPEGSYKGRLSRRGDNRSLFENVYD